MSPRVWLPVIFVFLVVLLFAGLRLTTAPLEAVLPPGSRAIHADPNLARSILNHLAGPKNDDEN